MTTSDQITAYPDGTVAAADLAEANYGGYAASSGGRSLASGDLLPRFSAMPEAMQRAWRAGTRAVVRQVVRHGELTQALAALRKLADPADVAGGDPAAELRARLAFAAETYARLAVTAGQLGLDDYPAALPGGMREHADAAR